MLSKKVCLRDSRWLKSVGGQNRAAGDEHELAPPDDQMQEPNLLQDRAVAFRNLEAARAAVHFETGLGAVARRPECRNVRSMFVFLGRRRSFPPGKQSAPERPASATSATYLPLTDEPSARFDAG